MDRVAVFIDYQNCYKGARECFFQPGDAHMCGQVLPRRLGVKLRDRAAGPRELVGVHVYRGLPSSHHDSKGYGAADRQIAMWKQQALVFPVSRPLNYRDPAQPREKGIDVRIAIDMVMAIERGDCTIAVRFTPSERGERTALLSIISNSNEPLPAVSSMRWKSSGSALNGSRMLNATAVPPMIPVHSRSRPICADASKGPTTSPKPSARRSLHNRALRAVGRTWFEPAT
jgi:hypothetical protein